MAKIKEITTKKGNTKFVITVNPGELADLGFALTGDNRADTYGLCGAVCDALYKAGYSELTIDDVALLSDG